MKTKIKLLARLLLVTLLFSFMGCSEDVYENHVHNKPIPLKNNISFEQFKRETGLSKFDTKIKINQNDDTVLNRNADGSYELSDFNIATDIIKRVDFDEKITYTFQIKPVVEVANGHFYNLTMFYKEGWQSLITELIPSVEHALELQQGTEEKFEGTMARLYQSDLPPNSIESCITIFVISTHCTGTGDCASGTCDGCDQCYSSDSYRLCSDTPATTLYINAGPSTGGSYSGGVGGPPNGATEPPFNNDIVIDPNLTDRSVFEDPNYINQFNTGDFYYNLDDNQQQWANNNAASFNQLIQYQIDNNWSDESKQFAEELMDLCIANNSSITIDSTITAQNGLVFNNTTELQDYINNFNNSVATNVETEDNGNNTKTSRFKFDLGMFAYLNVSVKQKLQANGQAYSIENVSSSISGLTLAMEWEQNDDDDVNISGNIATVTFTGTLSLNCFVEGIGVFFSDNVTIICTFNITTGALISSQLIGLE